MRSDLRKTGSCLRRVTSAGFRCAGLATSMKEVKATSAVLSATLAISVTKVISSHSLSLPIDYN